MNPVIFQTPFIQTALPIMFTVLIAVLVNNKAFDAINRRIDDLTRSVSELREDLIKRLDRIESKLDDHERRLLRVEAETSPVRIGRS